MINEKINQAVDILKEKNVDLWLTFTRETDSTPDPMLDLILGTQCVWPSAFMIARNGRAVAIVGSLDAHNVKEHARYEVISYVDSIKKDLLKTLHELNPGKIAINFSLSDVAADGITHGMYLMLCEYLNDTPYADRFVSSEEIVAAVRGRKSETEIHLIKGAIKETLAIFDKVTVRVKAGMSEQEVAGLIRKEMAKKDLEPAWDPEQCPAVFTGPESAGAHANPTQRKIQPGHIMNIDFGVRKNGYVSDLQRTWYFLRTGENKAPDEVERGFTVIREAIQKAAKALKPGVEGWTIDAVARKHITDAGYEEFPHGLGHQVGRKAHDGSAGLFPRWERYKNIPYMKIEKGQVFTLEPRLSVKDHGVATIEEIVVVTKDGCRFLSEPQEELILIPCAE
jgi:Xaa-Pro aminopeptidase